MLNAGSQGEREGYTDRVGEARRQARSVQWQGAGVLWGHMRQGGTICRTGKGGEGCWLQGEGGRLNVFGAQRSGMLSRLMA